MKKILVTGGVLFTIMPALALEMPQLIEPEDTGNCSGETFQTSPVNMQAIYVTDSCPAGQYFNVTNEATIGANGQITGAGCASCSGTGHYCPGVTVNATSGQALTSQGYNDCPTGYTDGADTTDINSCLANCSLNDLDYGSEHVATYTLVSNSATYNADPLLQQFCEKQVAVDGCEAGYTRKTLFQFVLDHISLDAEPTLTNLKADGSQKAWTIWVSGLSFGGVSVCENSIAQSGKIGCFVRMTSLNGHPVNGAKTEMEQFDTDSECFADCNYSMLLETPVMTAWLDGKYLCDASTININWGTDVNNQEIKGTCTYGGTYTAPETIPAADDGYKFIGWKVSVNNNNE